MAKTRKTIQRKNLAKYDVLIEDVSPTSTYFNVTNLPSVFTGGRNSFLLGGSAFLKAGSSIQIEILDANGNTIYQNPVQQYIEGNSRLISVEVNESAAAGPASIIIMGQATSTNDGTIIPADWQDTYNVRWIGNILVEPNRRNTAPLILQNTPSVIAEEQRLYSMLTSSFATQSVVFTASLSPVLYSSTQIGYLIKAESPTSFSADLIGGHITGSLIIDNTSASLYVPITEILNDTTALSTGAIIKTVSGREINKLYLRSGSYTTELVGVQVPITSSAIIEYGKLFTETVHIPVSYGKLRVVNLNTVSGEPFKVKVYAKVTTNFSDYKIVAEVPVGTSELLTSASIRGELPIGDFNILSTASANWYSNKMETSSNAVYTISGSSAYYDSSITASSFTLSVTDDVLLRSVRAEIPIYNDEQYDGYISSSGYFIGTIRETTVFPTTEYTMQLDAVYKKTSGSINLIGNSPKVDIYMVGTSGTKVVDNNPLGQKIGTLLVNNSDSQRYESSQFNFTPAISVSGTVGFRFVISNGFWYFSNISVKPASDKLFAPDEIQFLVPNTEYHNEYLQHKIEFFDINNNSTDVSVISSPTFFTGSNIDLGTLL